MKKKHLVARQIAFDAVLAAMYFALSFISIKLGNWKISVSGLPVLLGALLFGPLDGFLIGVTGAFLEQLISYGITVTTVLWILPIGCRGLVTGLYAKSRKFELSRRQTVFITVLGALLMTALNTAVMYADSKIFHYYSAAYVFGALAGRIVTGVITAVVFACILPLLTAAIRKHVRIR